MNEVIEKLREIITILEENSKLDTGLLIDSKNKLNLYIQKFFNSKAEYLKIVSTIDGKPTTANAFNNASKELQSLAETLIQDIELSKNDFTLVTEQEKKKLLSDARKEIDVEKGKIEKQGKEIQDLVELLKKDRENLLREEEKFDDFKAKLEIADKQLDFQTQADNNRKNAKLWAIASGILLIVILYLLFNGLDSNRTFSDIAISIKKQMIVKGEKIDSLITSTIYFTYYKFIITKILLYSLFIYAIVLCIKNYNAQMHNHIVNMHKSNAFKSTLSLLNTAKSDDGNDKLLVQATQAIFSHQNTGYGKENETTSPNLVTNVIDSVSKKI